LGTPSQTFSLIILVSGISHIVNSDKIDQRALGPAEMGNLLQTLINNWQLLALSVALTILVILLWRNFDIDEITPTPPFIKFKHKTKQSESTQQGSVNIVGNKMRGRNKIEVGTRPSQRSKKGKK
jgi:hypothetical protein